jgi:O-methyltransferase
MPTPTRRDALDPLPYTAEWPSLRSAFGRVDIHSLASAWARFNDLHGAYLEFGVGAGRSAVSALRANLRDNPGRIDPFVLFDSFEGLPAIDGPDTGTTRFAEGDYAFSEQQVAEFLTRHDVDASRVEMVPGYYERSLPAFDLARLGGRRAAIVHVDVDLYGSCRQVLDFVTPLLQPLSVLLFDDWNVFGLDDRRGERGAVRDWLATSPGFVLEEYAAYGWHGRMFIAKATDAYTLSTR